MSCPRSNLLSANDISGRFSEEDEMSVTQTRRNLQLLATLVFVTFDRRLAEAYELGDGVPVDPERAAAFKRRACDLGQQSACAGSRP